MTSPGNWQEMSPQDIKAKLPGATGPKKRFFAAKTRILRFQSAMHTVQRLQLLGTLKKPHKKSLISWHLLGKTMTSAFVAKKILHGSVEPQNLSRDCSNKHDVPASFFLKSEQKFKHVLASLECITSKF